MTQLTPQEVFEQLTKGLPKFDDGRINFTGVHKAPVLNVIVYFDGKILLVKRSDKVGSYKGLWNGISGFIDEPKSIEEFVVQEVGEELSLDMNNIKEIRVKQPYEVDDKDIDRVWVVYPILVVLDKKPVITLDWEHTDFAWITPNQLGNYDHVKDLDISIRIALENN